MTGLQGALHLAVVAAVVVVAAPLPARLDATALAVSSSFLFPCAPLEFLAESSPVGHYLHGSILEIHSIAQASI